MALLSVYVVMFQHTAARRRLGSGASAGGSAGGVSTHSRPKAAGSIMSPVRCATSFQHTAARRRLGMMCFLIQYTALVSTHSRPKAAGF